MALPRVGPARVERRELGGRARIVRAAERFDLDRVDVFGELTGTAGLVACTWRSPRGPRRGRRRGRRAVASSTSSVSRASVACGGGRRRVPAAAVVLTDATRGGGRPRRRRGRPAVDRDRGCDRDAGGQWRRPRVQPARRDHRSDTDRRVRVRAMRGRRGPPRRSRPPTAATIASLTASAFAAEALRESGDADARHRRPRPSLRCRPRRRAIVSGSGASCVAPEVEQRAELGIEDVVAHGDPLWALALHRGGEFGAREPQPRARRVRVDAEHARDFGDATRARARRARTPIRLSRPSDRGSRRPARRPRHAPRRETDRRRDELGSRTTVR